MSHPICHLKHTTVPRKIEKVMDEQSCGKERIPRRSFLVPQVNLFLGAPDLIVPFLLPFLHVARARKG